MYFDIRHGGSLLLLLYILPLILVAAGGMALAGKMEKIRPVVLPAAILGLIISGLGIHGGMEHLDMMRSGFMVNMMGVLGNMAQQTGMGELQAGSPTPAIGGLILLAAFAGALAGCFIQFARTQNHPADDRIASRYPESLKRNGPPGCVRGVDCCVVIAG